MIAAAEEHRWQPKTVEWAVKAIESSMGAVEVVTDAGGAFLKPLGGCSAGPHPLACEWVGSHLAKWFELPVPEFSIIELDVIAVEMINELHPGRAQLGPAFVSRKLDQAEPWDGSTEKLEAIENRHIIPRLVLFDMWTLNWDRCPPRDDSSHQRINWNNLLIVGDKVNRKKSLLVPIDFGECFSRNRELSEHVAHVDRIMNDKIYGLFEAFCPFMDEELIKAGADQLRIFENSFIGGLVEQIPDQWLVDYRAKKALRDFVYRRAQFLADNAQRILQFSNGQLF